MVENEVLDKEIRSLLTEENPDRLFWVGVGSERKFVLAWNSVQLVFLLGRFLVDKPISIPYFEKDAKHSNKWADCTESTFCT